ncbi:MAG: ATP-dependent DNA helicase [Candidatus Nanopelagicales bacterium]
MTQLSLLPNRISAVDLSRHLGRDQPPTPEQARAIEHLGSDGCLAPVLIVAGAGSGKTETMASRVVWLVANGLVRPERVLGLTFTKKASAELADRISSRLAALRRAGVLGDRADEILATPPTVSTYHAYAARLFVEHALRLGREPGARLLGEAATWQFAGRVTGGYDGAMHDVDWTLSTVTGKVWSMAGDLAEHLLKPADVLAWLDEVEERVRAIPPRPKQKSKGDFYVDTLSLFKTFDIRRQLLPMVEAYAELKRREDAVDYGDQVALAAEVARAHPVVGAVERSRFDLVLLDEYQDTGHAQKVLLTSLFGGGHPVTAVGDPCQSIYGWRGASAGNLRRFPQDFPGPGAARTDVLDLTTSFRNGGRILTVANAVSAELRASNVPVKDLVPGPKGPDSGRVITAALLTVDDESQWLAHTIRGLVAPDSSPRYSPHEIAVLCRRRAQFGPIESALRVVGVPVEVSGLGGLLTRPEVVDVVATLQVLTDAAAGAAAVRLLTSSRWLLGPRDLQALGDRAGYLTRLDRLGSTDGESDTFVAEVSKTELDPDHIDERSLVEAIDSPGRPETYSAPGYARLHRLGDELRALRRRLDQPLPDLVWDVVRTLRLDVEVAATPGADASVARGHLDRLIDVAAEFAETDEDPTVRSFLAYLAAAEEHERGLEAGRVGVVGDAVQLLTVHGAKGLEWKVVVIPGLVQGSFPTRGQSSGDWCRQADELPFPLRGDADDLPMLELAACVDQVDVHEALKRHKEDVQQRRLLEERRLMYVALTRAEDLVVCSSYWWDHTIKARIPSPFLVEVVATAEEGRFLERGPDVRAPGPDDVNPLAGDVRSHPWPHDPISAQRRTALDEVANWMSSGTSDEPDASSSGRVSRRVTVWEQTADRLLRDRAREARHRDVIDVALPAHLSVSQLVALRADADELARNLRRPVPAAPAPLARRGTTFHAWLEARFGGSRLLDLDEMPGSADEGAAPDADLETLKQRFLESAWADRTPIEVEVPFDTSIGGVVIRGRMDAVFADGSDGFEIVDWKTGPPPTGTRREAAAVQLAAYRLAWHRLTQAPLDRIKAAFHYVREDRTERPVDPLDEAGLTALITRLPSEVDLDDERSMVGQGESDHTSPPHGPLR